MEDHIKHVDTFLQILENNQLYVKISKCSFGKQEVEYLVILFQWKGLRWTLKRSKLLQNGLLLRISRVFEGFWVLQDIIKKLLRIMHTLQAHISIEEKIICIE